VRQIFMPVAGCLVLTACGLPAATKDETPLVRTMLVGQGVNSTTRYTGVVRARTESDLGFRVGGKVVQRLVDPGDVVTAGQVLLRLDTSDFSLAASASRNQVDVAAAEAGRAAAEQRRLNGLVAAGAISQTTYDAAAAAARAGAANLAAARASARTAANQTGYGALRADAAGVVTRVLAEPGQVVAAGASVVSVARGGREAAVDVPETRLAGLSRNGTAVLYAGSTPFRATLRELSSQADPATRSFAARYALNGGSEPPLGATVTIELPASADAKAVAVPLAALHDDGRGAGVWIVDRGRVRLRRVRVSAILDETVQIAAGLRGGERIVALGAHLLREGQSVRSAATPGNAR
jgi:RND family efflux transporter MFP subunit